MIEPCPNTSNIYCRALLQIGIYQPSIQQVPDIGRVENPYYDTASNMSYFSYGIIDVCDGDPVDVRDFLAIICDNTPLSSIRSCDLLLDSCPDYIPVDFDFNNSGGQTPPPGFKFLRVKINSQIPTGGCGIVRIGLSGNFPPTTITTTPSRGFTVITVNPSGGTGASIFGADNGLFPGCPLVPRITVNKDCNISIASNRGLLSYKVTIANSGNVDLMPLDLRDTISFNGSAIDIGQITVTPDTLNVDQSTAGMIIITGTFEELAIGSSIEVTYEIPITAINSPGSYTITNVAIARSGDIQGANQCENQIDAVRLNTDLCCILAEDEETLSIRISNPSPSPATAINYNALLVVSPNVFVEFSGFGNCTATFADDGEPVPLGTFINDRRINLTCQSNLPTGVTTNSNITFFVAGTTNFTATAGFLTLTLNSVTLQNPDTQLLTVNTVPSNATLSIVGNISCDTNILESQGGDTHGMCNN